MIFTVRGVKIRVEFSFLVFLTLLFLIKSGRTVFCFFTVCLVHEAGHAAAVCFAGGSLSEIIFCGLGIRMIPRRDRILPLKSELLILLAGPAVNLVLFLLLNAIDPGNMFAVLNLCAAVFNLMPYKLLDGGSVINLLSENTAYEKTVGTAMTAVRIMLTIMALTVSVRYGKDYFPLFCIAVFYLFSEFR